MSDVEYYCPRCEEKLAKWEYTAPVDHYRCWQCGLATPFKDLPRRSMLKTWTPAGQFGRLPISVTFKGSTSDSSGATSLTIPSVSVAAGDLLMVASITDGLVDQSNSFLRSNLVWGSVTGFPGNATGWQAYEFHTNAPPSANISVDGTWLLVASPQTNSVVVDYSASTPSTCKAAVVFTISGLSNTTPSPNDFWYFLNQSNTFGTSTNPACTPVLIRKAQSAVIAAVGVRGPSTDAVGTWNNDFQRIARVGTNGGGPDVVLDIAYVVTSAIQTVTGDLSGITSRSWLAVPTIFDRT